MKIAYFIHGAYNSRGMERVLSNKANYLVENGYDITIITVRKPLSTGTFFQFSEKISWLDLGHEKDYKTNKGEFVKITGYLLENIVSFFRMRKLLRSHKFDIIVTMWEPYAWITFIKDGSVKILESHLGIYTDSHKGIKKFLGKFLMQAKLKFKKWVVLTHEEKALRNNNTNMTVISNFLPLITDKVSDCTQKRAIAVGGLTSDKGFDDLIKIWANVVKKYPDWQLDIFGEGNARDDLQNLVNDLGLSKNVNLKGKTNDINKEYLNSSIHIMTSKHEGLPLVILESMACGVAQVSFACPTGPSDLIEDGENGFLIKPDDTQTMTDKILLLIEDEKLRAKMGRKGREFAINNFSKDKVMKQWKDLFNQVLAK